MNDASSHCVIVGAGHAAAQLCASLRRAKWSGKITLIGDEPNHPYHRPPLSKTLLAADAADTVPLIKPVDFYTANDIDVITGQHVDAIDRANKQISVNGKSIAYDNLVLATGSVHRFPPISGIENDRVLTLKTAADAGKIRQAAASANRVVIIGAGFIGLEVAASLRKQNIEVTVLELAPRVLARVASPTISTFFEDLHRQNRVELHTGVAVCELRNSSEDIQALTPDGTVFSGDFIVLGTGAAANSALAEAAGLEVDNGISVDTFNRTSDPAIYAMGDCCNQHHPVYNQRLRLESVQNANDQAKTVSAAITGNPKAHDALPWFWSDQYDVKYQIAGISTGYDHAIVRGNPAVGESFSVWHFLKGRLLAVDAINDARAYAVGSKLLKAGLSPAPESITDSSIELKQLLTLAKEPCHA